MEGLGNNSKATFISIIGGKFVRKVPAGTPGSVARINKNNVEVHEMNYDFFTGKLIDAKVIKHDQYGTQWNFTFVDTNNNQYVWTSPYSNGYSKAFLKILPNVDINQPMKISPSSKEVDGKTQNTVFVNQNGNVIKHAFTKDSPELPKMEKITVKGNETWDDTKQMEFLKDLLFTKVLSKVSTPAVETTHQWEAELGSDDSVTTDEELDF